MKTWGLAKSFFNEGKSENTRQLEALVSAGADEVLFEYQAKDPKKRVFPMLMEMVQAGDTIIALEACRMCSTAAEFCDAIAQIEKKHLRLIIPDTIEIDCRNESLSAETKALILLSSLLIKLERSKLYSTTRHGELGIRAPKKKPGRPCVTVSQIPALFFSYYLLHLDGQITVTTLANVCGISRPTAYKYMRILESEFARHENNNDDLQEDNNP